MNVLRSSVLVVFVLAGLSLQAQSRFDIMDFGAVPDGNTSNTIAIQAAVDSCFLNGGGQVYIGSGTYRTGTIYLKSNVSLYLESGAVLQASDDLDDFPSIESKYPSYEGEMVTNKSLIYAEDADNISIVGLGTIDGNGDYWYDGPYGRPSFSIRPRIIHLRGCSSVRVKGITLKNAASWVQSYQACSDMVIDGITVTSRPNRDIDKERFADARDRNNDGLDLIDCTDVRVANCFINSGDDSICLKSFNPKGATKNVTITNCVVSSNSSAIKIGTETAGTFENISIQNISIYDTRNDAIVLISTDGAIIDQVIISNINISKIKGAPIAIILGDRNRLYQNKLPVNTPSISNVLVENVYGKNIMSQYACSILGTKVLRPTNIQFKNINLEFMGGGTSTDVDREVPDKSSSYPSGRMLGKSPAFGAYIRHADKVTLADVFFGFETEDKRPAVVAEDVNDLEVKNLKADLASSAPEFLRLTAVSDAAIVGCKPIGDVKNFVTVTGKESSNILLINNHLTGIPNVVSAVSTVNTKMIREVNSIK